METTTLLPFVQIVTYDGHKIGKKDVRKCFADETSANAWLSRSGFQSVNVYRIDKINGTWRTDWQLISAPTEAF